jgi:hypothetical protein
MTTNESTIIVINAEQWGDSYVFHHSEQRQETNNALETFSDCDIPAERMREDFQAAMYEYDLADPDDLEAFIEECNYEINAECWTEKAAAIIDQYTITQY